MGDSDNEVEEFVITDYDLENEFFPGMKRRKMTKEQTMLGIWASRDSDDDEVGDKKRKANYSMPMQFISGGIVKTKDKDSLIGEYCPINSTALKIALSIRSPKIRVRLKCLSSCINNDYYYHY